MAFVSPLVLEDTGSDGEVVVMIHGLGGTSNTFQPLMGTLAGFRVIRPDMPGSGRSSTPLESLSIEGHAASVLAALTEYSVVRRRMIWNSRADFVADGLGSSGSSYAAWR